MNTIRIHTENSIYEVDEGQKLIRRLIGKGDPTARTGKDGEWKVFDHLTSVLGMNIDGQPFPVVAGAPMFIVWNVEVDGLMRCTSTSVIKSIETKETLN